MKNWHTPTKNSGVKGKNNLTWRYLSFCALSLFTLQSCAAQTAPLPQPITMSEALSPNLTSAERAVMLRVLPYVPAELWTKTIVLEPDHIYASTPELAATVEQLVPVEAASGNLVRSMQTGETFVRPSSNAPNIEASRVESPGDGRHDEAVSLPNATHSDSHTGIYYSEYAQQGNLSFKSQVSIPCSNIGLFYSPLTATYSDGQNNYTSTINQAADIYTGFYGGSNLSNLDIGFQMNAPTSTPIVNGISGIGQPAAAQIFSNPTSGSMYIVNGMSHVECNQTVSIALFPVPNPAASSAAKPEAAELNVTATSISNSNPSPILALVQPMPGSGYSVTGCAKCALKRVVSLAVPAFSGNYRDGSYVGVSNPQASVSNSTIHPAPTIVWSGTGVSTGLGCAPYTEGITAGSASQVFCSDFSTAPTGFGFIPSNAIQTNILLLDPSNYGGKSLIVGLNEQGSLSGK